jgi:hypothetical protein
MKTSNSTRQGTFGFFSRLIENVGAYIRKQVAKASRYFQEVVLGSAQPAAEVKVAPVPKVHSNTIPVSPRRFT